MSLLAALYHNAAASTVNRQELKTLGDLYQVLRAAGATLLPVSALPKVRRGIADEMDRVLGTGAAAPLDEAARKKAADEFNHVAQALDSLLK